MDRAIPHLPADDLRIAREFYVTKLYGTQYDIMRDSAGSVAMGSDGTLQYLIPVVVEPDRLDERRAAVGLKPWAEYEQEMAEMHGRAPVRKPLPDTLET